MVGSHGETMVDFVRKHLLIVLLLFALGVFSIALNVWS